MPTRCEVGRVEFPVSSSGEVSDRFHSYGPVPGCRDSGIMTKTALVSQSDCPSSATLAGAIALLVLSDGREFRRCRFRSHHQRAKAPLRFWFEHRLIVFRRTDFLAGLVEDIEFHSYAEMPAVRFVPDGTHGVNQRTAGRFLQRD